MRVARRAIRIVQVKDGGLHAGSGATAARGERICLELDRAPILPLGEDGDGGIPAGNGGSEEFIATMKVALWLLTKGEQHLLGSTASGGQAPHTRQQEAGRHDLHPVAPGLAVWGEAGTVGKLAFYPLPDLRLVLEVVEGTPVFSARFGFRARRGDRLHQR